MGRGATGTAATRGASGGAESGAFGRGAERRFRTTKGSDETVIGSRFGEHALVAETAGHTLLVQVLEQREHVLAAGAEEVARFRHRDLAVGSEVLGETRNHA